MNIIEYTCESCGCKTSYQKEIDGLEFGECTECGAMTYHIFHKPQQQLLRCPYCNSYKVSKISTLSKAASFSAFGLLSLGKITKQWKCNNCNSYF